MEADKKIILIKCDKIQKDGSWNVKNGSKHIWKVWINEKERETVESEVITNGVIKHLFEYATGYNSKVNAYAITECEFTEILPEIKRGIYLLYTEKEAIL